MRFVAKRLTSSLEPAELKSILFIAYVEPLFPLFDEVSWRSINCIRRCISHESPLVSHMAQYSDTLLEPCHVLAIMSYFVCVVIIALFMIYFMSL
jgi:hypothetical protein